MLSGSARFSPLWHVKGWSVLVEACINFRGVAAGHSQGSSSRFHRFAHASATHLVISSKSASTTSSTTTGVLVGEACRASVAWHASAWDVISIEASSSRHPPHALKAFSHLGLPPMNADIRKHRVVILLGKLSSSPIGPALARDPHRVLPVKPASTQVSRPPRAPHLRALPIKAHAGAVLAEVTL